MHQGESSSCLDDFCNDSTLQFCDVDGRFGGEPLTCIAVECTPQEFAGCREGDALICNAAGTSYNESFCELGCDDATGCITTSLECEPGAVRCGAGTLERCNAAGEFVSEACAAGCIESPEAHCAYLEPQYLPDVCDEPATAVHLDLGSVNTDDDSLCNGGIVPQTDGPADICVVRYQTITVPAGGPESKITGSRVLALVADSLVDVAGILDVSADGTASGLAPARSSPGVSESIRAVAVAVVWVQVPRAVLQAVQAQATHLTVARSSIPRRFCHASLAAVVFVFVAVSMSAGAAAREETPSQTSVLAVGRADTSRFKD